MPGRPLQCAVPFYLEVAYLSLGYDRFAEWYALGLMLEVVADDVVHAALLCVDYVGLRHNEIGKHILLCLKQCVRQDDKGAAGGNGGHKARFVCLGVFRAVDGTHHRVVAHVVARRYEEHEVFARCLGLAVGGVAVDSFDKDGGIRLQKGLVVGAKGKDGLTVIVATAGCGGRSRWPGAHRWSSAESPERSHSLALHKA